ncbi:MAG: GDP-mannose 4,6-dehydratase [Candidatus Sericytochromatia bacterium]|uniref:GDP-mannose 4,6-dehydratase n=1 Tax=Candidatus Tanganyikabacteria bacterium TaxID=2961651 RepID=A0A937X233_9BACT|nr:GDP-mannose 4,6-dehydratase [Candidatus Tanganyikabacteria bacterium]
MQSDVRNPQTPSGRRVLVTGGAGFIGSHLSEKLLSRGDFVALVDDFNEFYDPRTKRENCAHFLKNRHVQLWEGDIRDSEFIHNAFSSFQPDHAVHFAARAGVRPSLQDPVLYQSTNVAGTLNVLEACRAFAVKKLTFASSSSVYGVNSKIPFAERDLLSQVISPYAATKVAGEAFCQSYSHLYGVKTTCLRFFTVYGPRQRPDLAIHKFARLIDSGRPIPVFGDGHTKRDYTYIDDIIAGVLSAMDYQDTPFEIINLGDSNTVELIYLIRLLEDAIGKKATIDWLPEQPGDVPVTFADISKARDLLGYSPKTMIEDGIGKFVEWFKAVSAPSLA